MIKTSIKTYEKFRFPKPIIPQWRGPQAGINHEEINDVKIFYSTRKFHIQNARTFIKKYKKLKLISKIVQKLFIKKYGTHFGTVFSDTIMKDYLAVVDNTTEWYWVWYDDMPIRFLGEGGIVCDDDSITDASTTAIWSCVSVYQHRIWWATKYNIGINLDPRTII